MMLMDQHHYRRCEAYFAIYRRPSAQKRAGVFLQPDASIECLAVLGVYLGKHGLKHDRYHVGDVCSEAVVRRNSRHAAAAVADIAGDEKALIKIYWC